MRSLNNEQLRELIIKSFNCPYIFRHLYECHLSLLDLCLSHGIKGTKEAGHTFLAMKILTMKPAQFYIDNYADFNENNMSKLPISQDGYDDLDVTFNAAVHMETTKEQFHKVVCAIFMYQLLSTSVYFDDPWQYARIVNFLYSNIYLMRLNKWPTIIVIV